MPHARFETGNGITLCGTCHREVHEGFNGRPDMSLLMDSQGGEKIETMNGLYNNLKKNAHNRGLLSDEFYYLSDATLLAFKKFQNHSADTYFKGGRLEQASLIWQVTSLNFMNALLKANGFPEQQNPFLPGITIIYK